MTIRATIATIAVGMLLAVLAAPAAQAGPGQISAEAYQALHTRSVGLNVIYGLGKPAGMTHAQYRAVLIRSAALNERYGLPVALTSGEIARLYGTGRTRGPELVPPASVPPASVPRGDVFDWDDAAIGAAFAAGLALIGAAAVLVVARRAQVSQLRA